MFVITVLVKLITISNTDIVLKLQDEIHFSKFPILCNDGMRRR